MSCASCLALSAAVRRVGFECEIVSAETVRVMMIRDCGRVTGQGGIEAGWTSSWANLQGGPYPVTSWPWVT